MKIQRSSFSISFWTIVFCFCLSILITSCAEVGVDYGDGDGDDDGDTPLVGDKLDDDKSVDPLQDVAKLPYNVAANTLDVRFIVVSDPHFAAQREYNKWKYDYDNGDGVGPLRHVTGNINSTCDWLDNHRGPACQGVVLTGDLTRGLYYHHAMLLYRSLYEYDRSFDENEYDDWYDDAFPQNDYKIEFAVYPGIGNHDDATEFPDAYVVNKYIRKRLYESDAIFQGKDEDGNEIEGYFRHDWNAGDIYAWEWGNFHFINMGLWAFYAGIDKTSDGKKTRSKVSNLKIQWLEDHLAKIGKEKPIVLFQHFGWDYFSFQRTDWWTKDNADLVTDVICDRKAEVGGSTDCHDPYNVVGIFSGHLHEESQEYTITLGQDQDGNDVTLSNYRTDTAGHNKDHFNYFHVRLHVDGRAVDANGNPKGEMNVNQVKFVYSDGGPFEDNKFLRYPIEPWKTKEFNMGFSDWEQGQPDNTHGTESCAEFKSSGRFNDRVCSKLLKVACKDSSDVWTITANEHGWKDAPKVCESFGLKFGTPSTVAQQYDLMQLVKGEESVWVNSRSGWIGRHEIPGGFGEETSGGGIAMGNIDDDDRPDLIVLNIDNPAGGNHGLYRIGWNIDMEGAISSWTEHILIDGGFGNDSSGGGITIGNIDDDDRPDLIVLNIDNPAGGNHGLYRIGWNIDTDGNINPNSWTDHIEIPGWWGAYSSGGGISIGNIDDDNRPDLIVTHIDNPNGENKAYYRIGWNIDKNGHIDTWSEPKEIKGRFGKESSGAGITVGDIDGNGKLELISTSIDNLNGGDKGYYRIGWDIDTEGNVTSREDRFKVVGWFGGRSSGAGITVGNIDNDEKLDLIFFHIDNPDGGNHGYYRVGLNMNDIGAILPFSVDENGNKIY